METIKGFIEGISGIIKLLLFLVVVLAVFQLLKFISGFSNWELATSLVIVMLAYDVYVFRKKRIFSFKTDIKIIPKWELILKDLFPEVNERTLKKYISREMERGTLFFRYDIVEYYDNVSGLTQVWRVNDKQFSVYYGIRIELPLLDTKGDNKKTIIIAPSEVREDIFFAAKPNVSCVISKVPLSEFDKFVACYTKINSWIVKNGINWLIDSSDTIARNAWLFRLRFNFFTWKERLLAVNKDENLFKDQIEELKALDKQKKLAKFNKESSDQMNKDIEGIFESKYCRWVYEVKIFFPD